MVHVQGNPLNIHQSFCLHSQKLTWSAKLTVKGPPAVKGAWQDADLSVAIPQAINSILYYLKINIFIVQIVLYCICIVPLLKECRAIRSKFIKSMLTFKKLKLFMKHQTIEFNTVNTVSYIVVNRTYCRYDTLTRLLKLYSFRLKCSIHGFCQ